MRRVTAHPSDSITTSPVDDSPVAGAAGAPLSELPTAEPLLIDIPELGRLLCRSRASIERDLATCRLPREVRIGRSVRFRRDEIVSWVASGCPDRSAWEAMRGAAQKGKVR